MTSGLACDVALARLSAERQNAGISIMNELAVRPLAAAGNLHKAVGQQIGDEFTDLSWHARGIPVPA